MSILQKISFYQNQRNEIPNQKLAKELAKTANEQGIKEIAENLYNKNNSIRSDCLKVLYEIGYIKPELISAYANDFLQLLDDKNNRMVWGSMIALATIADINPKPIWNKVDRLIAAIDTGTLITMVWGIKALARVVGKNRNNATKLLPKLLGYLKSCKARDVPAHLESMLPMINDANWSHIQKVVDSRKAEMTTSHISRLKKVLKNILHT
jgi:hypothetical protein